MRQALDLSIDREAINQVVFNGEFKPGNQWVNPDHPYYQKDFPIRGRDVEKAKALPKEAGVTLPVHVDFMVPQGAETGAVAQVVQSMAAEAGFDMKIRVTEFATSLKQAEAGTLVPELCREHGISSATFYKWRSKFGGMDASLMSQLKELQDENRRLKKMYADAQLSAELLKEAMAKKW